MAKSGGRSTYQTQLLSANEYNNAINTNHTMVNERFDIKKEKFCDEISELRNRIVTAHNTSGIDGLDDSDIEFLQNEIDESEAEDDELMSQVEIANNDSTNGNAADSTFMDDIETENTGTVENDVNVTEVLDDFSGAMQFTTNDFNDRYYHDYDVAVRASIVGCLSAWNKSSPFSSIIYDKRFIGVLLKEVFQDELDTANLNATQLAFIKQVFDIRVNGDETRLNKFNSIVTEKQQKAQCRSRSGSIDTE